MSIAEARSIHGYHKDEADVSMVDISALRPNKIWYVTINILTPKHG